MIQAGDRKTFRWLMALAFAGLLAGAFVGAEFDPRALFGDRAARGAQRFLSGCWPPRTDGEFLLRLAKATLDTLAIAAVGTAIALAVGLPLGALSSRIVVYGAQFASDGAKPSAPARALLGAARTLGAVFRSVPEVVWALLFVRVTGLGPLPAVVALGVAYGGLLGKVFSEQMENVPVRPMAALEAVRAGRLSAFAWGVLPQAFGSMASYAAYRFECAVRASALMGFVGAGGLGFQIEVSSGDYRYGEVLTETFFLVALVGLIEWSSDALRRWIA